MMTEERKGELFIFSGAFLWSFFPIVTILSLSALTPLVSLSAMTFVAALFYFVVVLYRRRFSEIRNAKVWKEIFYIVLANAVGYYVLFFIGLKYTTAGNASLIGLMEVFFSFLFFNVFRREPISNRQMLGAAMMMLGAGLVFLPGAAGALSFNVGDLLILVAVMIAPIGNHFQQRVRKVISSESLLFLRYLITVPVIIILALLLGESFDFTAIKTSIWYVVGAGVLLFGLSKLFWIEGIHRISVTKSIALSSVIPLLTLFFAYLILREEPTIIQLLSFIPLAIGLRLLTKKGGQRVIT